ncbi:MAG: hypothetical protein AB7M12_14065 [Hyphomonadaceae bacterium]
MRSILAAAAFLAFAGAAQAAPLAIAKPAFAPEAQRSLTQNYGARDGEQLAAYAQQALTRRLAAAGAEIAPAAGVRLETTIVAVRPNKPTFKQLADRPGLDYARSYSLGGAEISGRFVDANGAIIRTFSRRWYETDLRNARGLFAWSDAERAIRFYADDAAKLYRASAALHARPVS